MNKSLNPTQRCRLICLSAAAPGASQGHPGTLQDHPGRPEMRSSHGAFPFEAHMEYCLLITCHHSSPLCCRYCGGCRRTSSCWAEPQLQVDGPTRHCQEGILRQGGGAHQHVEEVWDFARGHVVTCCRTASVFNFGTVDDGSCWDLEPQQQMWHAADCTTSNRWEPGAPSLEIPVFPGRAGGPGRPW